MIAPQNYRTECPSFRSFIEDAWPIVEPATPFIGGYHVDAIADHLQAISDGYLQNLIINIPPRHSKSSFVAVMWPAWEWIEHPSLRYLYASYALHLSIRDSGKCRDLIRSSWYQRLYGDRYQLQSDQNQKMYYRTDKAGHRLASSVGGVGTGEGGERIVIDDAHNVQDLEKAETERENVINWYDGAITSRANNPKSTARVIVGQRIHAQDLPGHLIDKMRDGGEQFEVLVLPAEYEPRVTVCLADTPMPLAHDPRTTDGEPLSPERFPTSELRKLEAGMGSTRYAGQYQQRPAPPGGAIFLRDWWSGDRNRYDVKDPQWYSKTVARVLSYDTAFKVGAFNDYTGLTVFDIVLDPWYIVHVRWIENRKLEFPDLVAAANDDAARWNYDGKLLLVAIEDAGSGQSLVQTIAAGTDQALAARVVPHKPRGSKAARARSQSLWCSLDMVRFPYVDADVPWVHDFIGPEPGGKLFKFPSVEHDDDVDSFTQGLWELEPYLRQGYDAKLAHLGNVREIAA